MDAVPSGHRTTLIFATTAAMVALLGLLPSSVGTLASAVIIALAGIPHGSLDLHLLSTKARRSAELVLYLASIAAVLGVWYVAPWLMLVVFLLNSAWHFGDCDVRLEGRLHPLVTSLYGIAVLFLLIDPTDSSVDWIIAQLVGGPVSVPATWQPGLVRAAAAVGVVVLPLVGTGQDRLFLLLRGGTIVAVSVAVPSLLAFTWYFAVLHSWVSMDRLRHHLSAERPVSWQRLLKLAAPLTLLTYLGLGVGAMLLPQTAVLALLFVALSALTVPHSRLFHRVYQPAPR